MKTLTTLAAMLAASLAASLAATPLAAQTTAAPARSIAVSHADLDLASGAGRRALDLRITHAVNAVCGSASPADLAGQQGARACRHDLHATARARRDFALAQSRTASGQQLAARR